MQQLEQSHAISYQNRQILLHSMQLANLTQEDHLSSLEEILGYVYKYRTYWKIRIKISQVTNIICNSLINSKCLKILRLWIMIKHCCFILTKEVLLFLLMHHWLLGKTTQSQVSKVDMKKKKEKKNWEI